MESNTPIFSIDELVKAGILAKPLDGNHGGIHPKSSDYVDTGVPFIMASDLIDGMVDTKNCKFITVEQANKLKKGFAKTGDVLLSHKATIGRTAIVGELDTDFIVLTPQVTYYRVKDPSRLNNQYLRYYFDSIEFQNLFNQWAGGGSTRAYLGITGQLKLPVAVPEIEEQLVIAYVLSTLDDKIELNRQINTTLEAMAQALFKSWFVDFDPVIDNALAAGNPIPPELAARAERRQQHRARANTSADAKTTPYQPLPADIQQQFPDRFVFTEAMGWVPEGWEVKSLDEIATYLNGLALQKFRPSDENNFLPVLKISHLRQGFTDGNEKASTEISKEYIVDDGDVIFSWSGTLLVDIWCGGKAALNQHLFKVTSKNYPRWFYYLQTTRHLNEFQRIAKDKAVTMGHIKREHLREAKCSVPSAELIEAAGKFLEPLIAQQIGARLSSNRLAKLRDTLLPKLLSGQLRIPDAEAAVDKALAEA